VDAGGHGNLQTRPPVPAALLRRAVVEAFVVRLESRTSSPIVLWAREKTGWIAWSGNALRESPASWAGRWVIPRRSDRHQHTREQTRWAKGRDSQSCHFGSGKVKRWGKSPPRWWRHHRQGKRRHDAKPNRKHLSAFFGEPGDRLARPEVFG